MALGIGRALAAPLLLLNFAVYMIVCGIAGWNLNKLIDGKANTGNGASTFFLMFALIAGVVGIASVFAGLHHLHAWRPESLGAAVATALTALLLTFLAFGLACKQIHIRMSRGHRLKTLEAFVIIAAGTELLYLLILHAGHINHKYGPNYGTGGYKNGPGAGGYGTPEKPGV